MKQVETCATTFQRLVKGHHLLGFLGCMRHKWIINTRFCQSPRIFESGKKNFGKIL